MREIRAFVLAPVPAAAIGVVLAWLMGVYLRPASVMLFYLVSLYIVLVLIGLPLRLLLRKFALATPVPFVLAGGAMVAMPAVPYVAWATGRQYYPLVSAAGLLLLWIALGALTGVAYWWLARPDRPAATGDGGALLLPPPGKVLHARVTAVEHYADELRHVTDGAEAEMLWAQLTHEAEHLIRQRAPKAFCAARSWERRLSCMIKLPDGTVVAEMVDIAEISEQRLGAIGDRLNSYAAKGRKPVGLPVKSRLPRPSR